jgi:hypothetical protein
MHNTRERPAVGLPPETRPSPPTRQEINGMTTHQHLFSGGRNLALKIPPHDFERTLVFYRDVLKLRQLGDHHPAVAFEFGPGLLWLESVERLSQAEIWLELCTLDTRLAADHLAGHKVVRCDGVETLPAGLDEFWISGPGDIVHLVHGRKEGIQVPGKRGATHQSVPKPVARCVPSQNGLLAD